MSVVGFDLGNAASCVAIARKRGIDVLMNKESKRETPNVVHFGDKMRAMGSVAAGKLSMYPKNTVTQIKRLMGKKFQDPTVQEDLKKFPFSVTEGPDGGCMINVSYCGQTSSFTPEQLTGMTFVDLKGVVTTDQGIPVTDCVVSVPTYATENERSALLDAANIAGLNVLRLMNDTTATALAYGIFKTDLPETEPTYVAFVDVGDTSLQVSIVALKKAQLRMLSSAWDRDLGGRDFTEVLFEHFAKEFYEKTKMDAYASPKASFRLRTNCEKTKKILSANMQAMINVECLMEDTDFSSTITRETFEELCKPLLAQVMKPCEEAVALAGIPLEQISSVEVVGSGSRVPTVQKIIETYFQKPASRTLNSKECVARGCALQCAMLSPIFKVREFEVIDWQPYGISFQWEKDNQPQDIVLFEKGCAVPSTKLLTFSRSAPFSITSKYVPDERLPAGESGAIGLYKVGKFKVPKGADKAKLKVKIKLNANGLVELDSVQTHEEEEIEVKEESKPDVKAKGQPKPADAPAADAGETNGADENETPPAESAGAGNEGEKDGGAAKEAEKTEAKTVKKKRTKKTDVPVEVERAAGFVTKQLNDCFEQEGKMMASDRLQEETNDKKNALESYILSIRHKIYDDLAPYVKEEARSKLSKMLDDMEDWLYGDGEDVTKSVYVAKLEELRKLGDPIQLRKAEDDTRPAAAQELGDLCSCFKAMATSDAKEYEHIEAAEKEKVVKECDAAVAWLHEKMNLQMQLEKFDEPALLTQDVRKRRDTVERVCKPIMEKPVPKPPAPAKAEEAKPAGEAPPASEDMDVEKEQAEAGPGAGGAAGGGSGGGDADAMDIDV
ncbi:hypothetical protein BSKO_08360 [Bryopsis sp. KO-2023]|nr:hypothetical protein BSKO_08360 [Bryopsis sp. KO-2023]